MNSFPNTFTWSYQLTGNDPHKMIPKGRISFIDFIEKIENFSWKTELVKANQNPQKSYPTFSVKKQPDHQYLWVSVYGFPDSLEYLIGYIFPKTDKGSLSNKAKMTFWEEVYSTLEMEDVKSAYFHFFNSGTKLMLEELKKLDLYGSSEIDEIIH